uniref:Uncharacterized protein n=1 Tax=Hydrogenophaga sp. PL2G6 TaxID=503997 RepID=B4Y335_9BURK|nr:hypothetical protein [Hydrogenophaga sp. PL2G6]
MTAFGQKQPLFKASMAAALVSLRQQEQRGFACSFRALKYPGPLAPPATRPRRSLAQRSGRPGTKTCPESAVGQRALESAHAPPACSCPVFAAAPSGYRVVAGACVTMPHAGHDAHGARSRRDGRHLGRGHGRLLQRPGHLRAHWPALQERAELRCTRRRHAGFPVPRGLDTGHSGSSSAHMAQSASGRDVAPLAPTHFRLIPCTAQPTRRWCCCRAL